MEKLSRQRRNRASSDSIEAKMKKTTAIKLKKRKFLNAELPSPPPDPHVEIFADRVMSYENSATKAATNVLGLEDAFDHLDKLHSMMESIIEMRQRNAKLFRRVRDLERVKVTRKANAEAERLLTMGQDIILPDEDVGFAESLLGAMLSSSFQLSGSRNGIGRNTGSGRIARSRSIGIDNNRRVSCPVTIDTRQRGYYRPRVSLDIKKKRPLLAVGTPKVSKWTRVKSAFKWERAACTNQDVIVEPEFAVRYLKIPENIGGSSEVSGPPTPAGTISSSSSIDDVFHRPQRPSSNQSTRITRRDENSDPSRRSRSLDGDASVPMNFVYGPRPRSKDNSCLQGKSVDPRIHKTPWGKVKDMIQLRRDSIGRLPARSISRNDDAHSTSSLDSSDIHRSEQQVDGRPPRFRITGGETNPPITTNNTKSVANDFLDLASRRLTPTLTITVPSSEELRNISSAESITPSPPSPRQSLESGKFERYSPSAATAAGYDTPRETRTGQVSPASSSSGILRYSLGRSKTCQGVPFAGDYKRQQSLKGESLGSSPKMQRRDSKWNKVKRAFLTSATSVPTSPNRISSYFFDDGDATGGSYSASASAEDLDNETATSPGVHAEIQRNYRLLHEKLGTEFYRKLAEWERLKSNNNSSSIRDSSGVRANTRERDSENSRIIGEDRLTPEFKKKLEEWKRMNKNATGGGDTRDTNSSGEGRSVNRRRITDWQLWRSPSKPENKAEIAGGPRLSEDFKKKMEEWKRIKSGTSLSSRRGTEVYAETQTRENRREGEENNEMDDEEEEEDHEEEDEDENEEDEDREIQEDRERLSGNRLSEKRRIAWKSLEDEEFRSLERVLEAMEMDRQTRLSKLQRMVGSQPQRTQEVLIHTSTGLYRFEGISRQFTRKLYEWEKSQGISPELSTFRLLDPLRYGVGYPRNRTIAVDANDDGAPRRNRHRSKSVGCVDIDSWRTKRDNEKTTIRRPCSLSLNDIDNIDARSCIIASSIPTIPDEEDTSEDIAMEDSEAEPEAVIVDIEDVIEETASPLRKYQPHQTPVYSVAGSETTSIAIPLGTVTARHEPSPVILIEPGEIHPLRARACSINEITNETFYARVNNAPTIVNMALPSSSTNDQQRQRSIIAGDHRSQRESFDVDEDEDDDDDELSIVDNEKKNRSQIVDDDEGAGATEDSNENWRMAPLTRVESDPRTHELRDRLSNDIDESFEDAIVEVRSNSRHTKKLLKTRRLTDTQVGYDWLTMNRPKINSNSENDEKNVIDNGTDDNSLSEINDEFEDNPNIERIIINEETINKIVVPTALSSRALSVTLKNEEDDDSPENPDDSLRKEKREATSVFVKTKRIVFSPFRREAKNKIMENSSKTINSENFNETASSVDKTYVTTQTDTKESFLQPNTILRDSSSTNEIAASTETTDYVQVSKRPSLPGSPILARKDYKRVTTSREKSPSIRMMIRRYNEKLVFNDSYDHATVSFSPVAAVATSSTTSSCSGGSSPSWRTPLTERKLPDRYDEAKKALTSRNSGNESCCESCQHPLAILSKSRSVDFAPQRTYNLETRRERTMEPEFFAISPTFATDSGEFGAGTNENLASSSSSIRAMKIRRAKERFLSMDKHEDARDQEKRKTNEGNEAGASRDNREDTRDRTSDQRSSFSMAKKDIVKSASAGMINIDEDTYERLKVVGVVDVDDDEEEEDVGRESLADSREQLGRREMREETTASRLTRIANKFKRSRLRRAKERENSGMRTILKLCRQSLLVDIEIDDTVSKSETERTKDDRTGS